MDYLLSETSVAYSIGALGYAFFVVSSYFRTRTQLLGFDALGSALVAVQWLMIGEMMPAVLNLAYAYVAICGIFLIRHAWVKMMFPAVFPFVVAAFFLWSAGTAIDILTIIVGVPTLAVRYAKNTDIIRGVAISGSVLWMIINASSGVFVGAACNLGYGIGHLLFFIRKYRALEGGKALSPA